VYLQAKNYKQMNKCLYCYKEVPEGTDFHEKCASVFFGSNEVPEIPYSMKEMEELAKKVVERRISVPGVQAKLSMSLVKDTVQNNSRLTVVDALGGNYILKPPSSDYPEMPENEHVTMRLAEVFGIRVVPYSLIRLKSGELAYITKRIDRTKSGEKIHMLDMFQITEAYEKYKGSMEKVGKAIGEYSSNTNLDKIFFFELALFSFLTGNNDMHLKNFSMIESPSGWVLAPAYDLLNVGIVLPEDTEELALTLGGKKKKLTGKLFKDFGKTLGLTEKQVNSVFLRFNKHKAEAEKWIQHSFLSDDMKEKYLNLIDIRYSKFL
jgi:serine/threonine-protein kinase HipA